MKLEAIHAQSGDHEIVNLVGTFPISCATWFPSPAPHSSISSPSRSVQGRRPGSSAGSPLADMLLLQGNTYKMPLHVRVLPDYPASAPVVFLVPAPNMAIMKNHVNIDQARGVQRFSCASCSLRAQTGRCHFPYLLSWNAANSTLAGLLRVMVQEFSKMPPLYTKPAGTPRGAACSAVSRVCGMQRYRRHRRPRWWPSSRHLCRLALRRSRRKHTVADPPWVILHRLAATSS